MARSPVRPQQVYRALKVDGENRPITLIVGF
jgi:hypothetical protein